LTERREAYHHEFRLQMPDGSERWLSGHAAIRSNRIFGVNFDITERKKLEQRAKELSECLVTIQEEERQRISQELHDSTSQHFVAANLTLMSLRPKAGLTSDEIRRWDETETYLQEGMRELRTFSYLMHPPTLQSDGLHFAIRQYVRGYIDRSGLEVRVRSNPKLDTLPYQIQRTLLRIVQEALANVHRHAIASRVALDLRCIGDAVHVIVSDNGSGGKSKNGKPNFSPGCGILGMTARVHQYDGGLRIHTSAHGTTVHALLPASAAGRRPFLRHQPFDHAAFSATFERAKATSEQTRLLTKTIQSTIQDIRRQLRRRHKLP